MDKSEAIQLGGPSRAIAFLRTWVFNAVTDWPVWWKGLTPTQKARPGALVGLYWIILQGLHGLRNDHFALGGAILVLSYAGREARRLRAFALPFLMTGILYDSQRYFADYIRGPVHVTEPYRFDKYFFGISTAQGVLTPNEFWQAHIHPALDLICGFAYLVFFTVFILQSAFFYFWVSRAGTETMSPGRVKEKANRMIWGFLWLNLVGWSTYYWYAASPPWYVSLYGLGPARLDVAANPGGCARFDQILGTHFFSEMYGRAADVHGAIPSLHVAYPLLAVIFAFQFRRNRVFSVCFYLLMCFSAVYLNHHYILDILWGSAYAVLAALSVDFIRDRVMKRHELTT